MRQSATRLWRHVLEETYREVSPRGPSYSSLLLQPYDEDALETLPDMLEISLPN